MRSMVEGFRLSPKNLTPKKENYHAHHPRKTESFPQLHPV